MSGYLLSKTNKKNKKIVISIGGDVKKTFALIKKYLNENRIVMDTVPLIRDFILKSINRNRGQKETFTFSL